MSKACTQILSWVIFLVVFVLLAIGFARFFSQFQLDNPRLGIDNTFYRLENWSITYDITGNVGPHYPPWSALFLIPLGSTLTNREAWGVLVLFSLLIALLCIPPSPKRGWRWVAIFLTITAYPALRNIADANIDALVFGGIMLSLWAYPRQNAETLTVGLLLATAKPQVVSLLVIVLGVYLLQRWAMRRWLLLGFMTGVIVAVTMLWRGGDWLQAIRGHWYGNTLIDISLDATLMRIGITSPIIVGLMGVIALLSLWVAWCGNRAMSYDKAGMLVCASILVAPYVAGNSLVNIVVVGLIPLLLVRPWLALGLLALVNFPYFRDSTWVYAYGSSWTTFIVSLSWGIFVWRTAQEVQTPLPSTG